MKTFIKKCLLFFVFIFVFFGLFLVQTKASMFPDNFSDTGSLYCGGWQQGIFQPIGSGYDGILSNIRVKGSLPPSGNFYARLYEFTDKTTATLLSTNDSLTISEDLGYITATFNNITINSGSYYQLAFMNDNTTANLCIRGGASGQLSIPFASYPDGDNAYYFSNPTWYMQQNNIYMDWNYSTGGGSNNLTVALEFPLDSLIYATSNNPNFTNWMISVNGITSSTQPFTYYVQYSYNSSSSFQFNSQGTYPGVGNVKDNLFVIPRNRKYPLLTYGTHWYAQPYLLVGTNFVYGDVVEFDISSTAPNYPKSFLDPSATTSYAGLLDQDYQAPTISECKDKWLICLHDTGFDEPTSTNPWLTPAYYGCVMDDLLRSASYCGSEDAQAFMQSKFESITQNFPFNMIFGTVDIVVSSTLQDLSTDSLSLDMGNTLGTLIFADSNTFPDAIGSDGFIKLQNFAGYAIKAAAFLVMLFAIR